MTSTDCPLGNVRRTTLLTSSGRWPAIELDSPIHDRGIDQRAVGIDPHQGIGLRRHRSVQEAAGDVVERAAIELHGLRPGELGDGVVIGIGRGRDPQAIDGAAAAHAVDHMAEQRSAPDRSQGFAGQPA